jgi:hypothetical protein
MPFLVVLIALSTLLLAYVHSHGAVNALKSLAFVIYECAERMDARFKKRAGAVNEAWMRKLEAR